MMSGYGGSMPPMAGYINTGFDMGGFFPSSMEQNLLGGGFQGGMMDPSTYGGYSGIPQQMMMPTEPQPV